MKKRTVKTAICALLLAICLSATVFALTACDENNLLADYAEAQSNWYAAGNKVVCDTLTIDGNLGGEDVKWPISLSLDGYRAYIGDEWRFEYDIVLGLSLREGGSATNFDGSLSVTRTADGIIDITLVIDIPLLGAQTVAFSTDEATIRNYIPIFDFADNMYYDAEKISGSADAFTVSGADCLAYVFYQLAPTLSNNFNFDMLPMLEKWLSIGDVTGTVSFADGNFATATTHQSLSVFAPDEDLLFLAYNLDNFPDMLINLFENKKLSISVLNLDLTNAFKDGIALSATIDSSAEYHLLGSDATFDSIKATYCNVR